ncbi:putative F-box domain-containing protein [Helianthus annuus]|uniref:F-box domain-containing protein n=1 Tax=Helianthus annuus TaxID=4232 RepID=A0A251TC49_HELAN|nr:putative F-box domain-containing protein [Helianthus annuus]KAJ0465437.1 putative F-box domain-containing protein [Helianthus annuus]KAJ0470288.1 putative F-box domain-containing protein [Helianthus annuus]KAJ0487055.1 putative F-box domain-containing protein [Helianthus annuus]KAJ0661179.1 putative F-box domain-containing protein [Helianthus annuus]
MANVYIGDDVLRSILARLPGKPLLRFRCASKHWNRLISDPYFMKSRSRRMVLFPLLKPLVAIDENVPVEDNTHSMVRIPPPLEPELVSELTIVGTFSGIVLLAIRRPPAIPCPYRFLMCDLILYNPLTRASKVVANMKQHSFIGHVLSDVFGFGHGENPHDLKIVRFDYMLRTKCYRWDVFDLKTSSWSKPQFTEREFYFWGDAGVFLNGFLYWVTSIQHCFNILALNVKEMGFLKIKLSHGLDPEMLLLGSIGGCLCTINKSTTGFDVWLMKQQCDENSWMKAHSFNFGLEGNRFYPICVLGNGKILMTCSSIQFVIYDTSKDSYKTLNALETLDHIDRMIFVCKGVYGTSQFKFVRSIEYVESWVSPSEMCFI